MQSVPTPMFALPTRPLAAALATLLVATAAATAVALPAPTTPTGAVVQNCDDDGAGSLRAALAGAVSGDTIDLTQLSCSSITLTTGALTIPQTDLAIAGPGPHALAVDGNNASAVLYGLGSGTLSVSGLSIVNGVHSRLAGEAGGACIHANNALLMDRVLASNCRVYTGTTDSALGGAVFAGGGAAISHSTITHSGTIAFGDAYSSGGGLYVRNGLSLLYSTVADNGAFGGGNVPSYGGGVFARGSVLMVGSTLSGNRAKQMGGLALVDYGGHASTIVNSTISTNTAEVIGGVFSLARLDLYNSTIAFNVSNTWEGAGGQHFAAGLHITVSGEMDSTIIANNVAANSPFATADMTVVPGGGFNGGHNNVMFCASACPTDTTHEDPGLGRLQDNGGPTLTHIPTPGQWDTFGGTNILGWPWDQRGPGYPRNPAGIGMEIGAFQQNPELIFANGFN